MGEIESQWEVRNSSVAQTVGIGGRVVASHESREDRSMVQPLHDACRAGDVETLVSLLQSGEYDVDGVDDKKRSALHLAAWRGDAKCIQALIQHHCDTKLQAMDGSATLFLFIKSSI